jgi:hypothetical protein
MMGSSDLYELAGEILHLDSSRYPNTHRRILFAAAVAGADPEYPTDDHKSARADECDERDAIFGRYVHLGRSRTFPSVGCSQTMHRTQSTRMATN